MLFPSNFILFTLITDSISIYRMKNKYKNNSISIINPKFDQIGMSQIIMYDLGIFEQLKFNGFVKKQRCIGSFQPEKFNNVQKELFQIYKKANYASLLSYLAYVGVMNLKYFEDYPIYKDIFQNYYFEQKRLQQNNQNNQKKPQIINRNDRYIKINWQQFQRYQISQKLQQTIVIKDLDQQSQNRQFFTITLGHFTNQQCYDSLQNLLAQRRKQFIRCIEKFQRKGKIIKYLCIKGRFKQIMYNTRDKLQQQQSFGGVLIFDQWPNSKKLQLLKQLDNKNNCIQNIFVSVKNQQRLQGYDFILGNNSVIYHSQQQFIRTKLLFYNIRNYRSVIHIGNSLVDQSSLVLSDISIKIKNDSPAAADYQISQPEQIIQLLIQGRWNLDTITITLICLILFIFGRIITQIFIFLSNPSIVLNLSLIPSEIDQILLIYLSAIIIPLILLNLYSKQNKIGTKYHKNFFRIDLAMNVIILIIGLVALFGLEFMDKGFQQHCLQRKNNIIDFYDKNKNKQNHFIRLRNYHYANQNINSQSFQSQLYSNHNDFPCTSVIYFLNISFNFLIILLLDISTQSRQPKDFFISHINKFYMLIIWIFSIIYYKVPKTNIFRSAIIFLIVFVMMKIFQWIKTIKNNNQINRRNQNNNEEQEDTPERNYQERQVQSNSISNNNQQQQQEQYFQ